MKLKIGDRVVYNHELNPDHFCNGIVLEVIGSPNHTSPCLKMHDTKGKTLEQISTHWHIDHVFRNNLSLQRKRLTLIPRKKVKLKDLDL